MDKKIKCPTMQEDDIAIICAERNAMRSNPMLVPMFVKYFPNYRTDYFENAFIIFDTVYLEIRDICDKLNKYIEDKL